MNFRRILVSSGSHLWKRACTTASENSHLLKRNRTTVASAAVVRGKANDETSGSTQKAKVASMKRKMFKKLRNLSETGGVVAITLSQIMSVEEEGVSITQTDLVRWAKLLDKHCEHQHAYEIFEWMSRRKFTFSPNEHAVHLDLIAKTKGTKSAQAYFDYIDPNFDHMNTREKNWPAYQKLWDWRLKDYPVYKWYLKGCRNTLTTK